jgi:membrane-associated phospholipid phosphatase
MPDNIAANTFVRFSRKSILNAGILLAIYCLWIGLFIGFRSDHVFLICFGLLTYFLHPFSRRFIVAFFVFVVYWIVYDSMRIYPNYLVNDVHIKQPYDFEKMLFGINEFGKLLTPNEYFQNHTHAALDIIAGLFYINWVPVPLAFAFYLMIKDKPYFLRFAYAFVLTNFIGFAVYYLYPAAPPWYISQYGFELNLHVPPSMAGLSRFDQYVGVPIFHSIYSKNANIFAAIPSLHSAYPVIVLFYGLKRNMGWVNILFAVFLLGVWFSAVYSGHHYIIDVIIGAACAILSIYIFEYAYAKPRISNWFLKLAERI